MTLKACPQCGDIRESEHDGDGCRRCYGAGHLYRLMTVGELTVSAERNRRDGFELGAIKRALIRDALLCAIEKCGT